MIYRLDLPKGPHEIRWVLTGGKFQPSLLKFQAAETGVLLDVYHTARQRAETGVAKAAKTIDAQAEVKASPPGGHPWTRVSTNRQ